mmetsp:Transcript_5909/g.22471  ORF Transcript_5909/g.22471 Transcript_5909/m.22471 type:complete len:278 (+) Transcript_5909:2338-3171(+)
MESALANDEPTKGAVTPSPSSSSHQSCSKPHTCSVSVAPAEALAWSARQAPGPARRPEARHARKPTGASSPLQAGKQRSPATSASRQLPVAPGHVGSSCSSGPATEAVSVAEEVVVVATVVDVVLNCVADSVDVAEDVAVVEVVPEIVCECVEVEVCPVEVAEEVVTVDVATAAAVLVLVGDVGAGGAEVPVAVVVRVPVVVEFAPVAAAAAVDVTGEVDVAVEDVVVAVVVVLVAVDVEVEVGEVVENVPVVLVQVMMADPSNSWNRTASASAEMP